MSDNFKSGKALRIISPERRVLIVANEKSEKMAFMHTVEDQIYSILKAKGEHSRHIWHSWHIRHSFLTFMIYSTFITFFDIRDIFDICDIIYFSQVVCLRAMTNQQPEELPQPSLKTVTYMTANGNWANTMAKVYSHLTPDINMKVCSRRGYVTGPGNWSIRVKKRKPESFFSLP